MALTGKFLDSTGLNHLWSKITAYIDSKIGGTFGKEDSITKIGYDSNGNRQITEVSDTATTVTTFEKTDDSKIITSTRTPTEGNIKHITTTTIETKNGEKVITETNTTVSK